MKHFLALDSLTPLSLGSPLSAPAAPSHILQWISLSSPALHIGISDSFVCGHFTLFTHTMVISSGTMT